MDSWSYWEKPRSRGLVCMLATAQEKGGFVFQRRTVFSLSTSGVLIFTLAASAPLTVRNKHFLAKCLIPPDTMIAEADGDHFDINLLMPMYMTIN